MPKGLQCNIVTNDPKYDKYQNDIVHPCVRFSEDKFRGFHWWLVYTPYYKANSKLENPILTHGIANENEAPIEWKVEMLIRDTPKAGYNSDPTMFFSEIGLHVFWRESDTERTSNDNASKAIYGVLLNEDSIVDLERPILLEKNAYYDKEVSPTIVRYKDRYRAFAADVRFKNPKLQFKNKSLNAISNKIMKALSVIDIYDQQKSFGIAIYESFDLKDFQYIKTVKLKNCNKLYKPWHFDFFEFEGKLYAIVQTNQFNADICLIESSDYENFKMFKKPLITQSSIKKLSLYKATGIVLNGIFHLYYTAQDVEKRGHNKLYYSKMPMKELLDELCK